MIKQNKNAVLSPTEMNDKFATSSAVFDTAFGKINEFLGGVTEHVGLPATNLMRGMENNFCHGNDAHAKFETSNYEGTTTPVQEFDFVVWPDLAMEYPGKCRATHLDVYCSLRALAVATMASLDMPLAEIALSYQRPDGKSVRLTKTSAGAGHSEDSLGSVQSAQGQGSLCDGAALATRGRRAQNQSLEYPEFGGRIGRPTFR